MGDCWFWRAIVTGQYDSENWVYQTSSDNEVDGRPLRDLTGVAYKNERWVIVGAFKLIGYTDPVALVNGVELNAFSSQVEVSVAVDRDPVDAVIESSSSDVTATLKREVTGGDITHESGSSLVSGLAERIVIQTGQGQLTVGDVVITAGDVERIIAAGDVAIRPTTANLVTGGGERLVGSSVGTLTTTGVTVVGASERTVEATDGLQPGPSSVSASGVNRVVVGIDVTPQAQDATVDVEAKLTFLIRVNLKNTNSEVTAQVSRSYAGTDQSVASGPSGASGSGNIGRYSITTTPKAQNAQVVALGERGINAVDATPKAGDAEVDLIAERIITAIGELQTTPTNVEAEGISEREINTIDVLLPLVPLRLLVSQRTQLLVKAPLSLVMHLSRLVVLSA